MTWQLRDYQETAKASVFSELSNGSESTIVVMPTGTGKTQVMLSVADEWPNGDVLVLAHRQELIWQPFNRWKDLTGTYGEVEMADMHRSPFSRSKITFGSKDTLCRYKRLRKAFPDPSRMGLIIIDEAHHAVKENKSYQRIIDYFMKYNQDLRVLGVTATPDRADEKALGQNFKTVAFDYPLLDPNGGPSAIGDGWLVPIRQDYVVVDGLDFKQCNNSRGDFTDVSLERELTKEGMLHRLTAPTITMAGNKSTTVFCAGVKQASRMAEIFNRVHDGNAYCLVSRIDEEDDHDFVVNSQDKSRRQRLLKRFESRQFQYLCNVGVLTEGYDNPTIEMLCMGRMTRSRSLYCQMVGRGTRPLPGVVDGLGSSEKRRQAIATSEKPYIHVLDFVGNSKHKLISSVDILGGKYPDETVAAAKKAVEKGDVEATVEELLATCDKQRVARIEKRKQIRASATYTATEVDPFGTIGVVPSREPGWFKGREPTDRMRQALQKFKVEPHVVDGLSFWQASTMLDGLVSRSKKKLATYKQCKLLGRYNVSTTNLTFERAGQLITRLKRNGWKYL